MLTLAAINASVFATDSLSLLVEAGLSVAGILLIKLYYTGRTMKEYLDRRGEEEAEAIEVPSSEEESAKAVRPENDLAEKLKDEGSPAPQQAFSKSRLMVDS